MNSVCILGLGYIGLPTAAMFATHGKKIIGVDVNKKIISTIKNGDVHIEEPGLKEMVLKAIQFGDLSVHSTPKPADAFIIAVPTPFKKKDFGNYQGRKYKKADLNYVIEATKMIVPFLKKGNLVVLESTSPPKTTIDVVKPILETSGLKAGSDFFLVYSPERVLPGRILEELKENARVIGGINKKSAEKAKELYQCFVQGDIITTDTITAEMVKLMENTYRDVNIALANEFSRLSGEIGFDLWEAIKIANYHPRVNILNPGPGVGGHCISVDPWFLVESVPEQTGLIYQAREINDTQPDFVINLIKKATKNNLRGKKIAALGLAYKPDVDDMRESPALKVIKKLMKYGAIINTFEPHAPGKNFEGITSKSTLNEAVNDAEIILLLVGHRQFISLKPDTLRQMTSANIIIDAVNGFDPKSLIKAGFSVVSLGKH